MGTLDGKIAIITGAGGGIGRGIALALAKEGAPVAIIDINEDGAKETLALVEAAGATGMVIGCDIRNSSQVDAAVETVVERFGTVDILVNNAMGARGAVPFEEITDADLELAFGTGPSASIYFMRSAFPYLKDGYGRIVNVRSGSEIIGLAGMGSYIAAKGAIGALTRVAAKEWGKYGITVNCIAPSAMSAAAAGYIEANPDKLKEVTDALSIPRLGDPESDIGRTVAFLVGPDASFVTGTTVSVDGSGVFYA